MEKTTTRAAGIDTAKSKLDVAVNDLNAPLTVDNTGQGWIRLADHLRANAVDRVGIEATGGYERGVVRSLRDAGFTVLVIQPIQVKAFARLHLRRAKNDAIDAALIAACTATLDPRQVIPDHRLAKLADILTFVEQTGEDIVRCKTRLEHIHDPRLRQIVEDDIATLDRRRDAWLAHIAAELRAHADLATRLDLVLSIPGIGETTAVAVVVLLPELGLVSRGEIAALAGLAPFDNDSGTSKGQRHIAGGRERLRRAVYAATLPAAFRWNKPLIALYKRLTDAGKPHKLAMVACARKLVIYANTVVARGTPWEDRTATT
jgi:transposase